MNYAGGERPPPPTDLVPLAPACPIGGDSMLVLGEEERTARPRDWLTSIYVALSPDTLDVKGVASCSLICRSFRLALGAIRFP